jgi:outer membrane lipoprotein-sorting protein
MSSHDSSPPEIDPELAALLRRIAPPTERADTFREILRGRSLVEYDRALELPSELPWRRTWQRGFTIMRHPVSRFVAATAAVLLVALWLSLPRPSVAFGDLLAPLLNATSAKFKMVVKNDLQPKPIEATGYFLAPRRMRQEILGTVNTVDFDRGRMLWTDPARKQAMVIDMKDWNQKKKKAQENFLFDNLRSALAEYRTNKKGVLEELGEKELDGRRVFGFRLSLPSMVQTVWGDVQTSKVVRLEATTPGPPKSDVVFSDFEFDMPLEESLFSVDPPADYKSMAMEVDVSPAVEGDFIASLDKVSSVNDGQFPAGLGAAAVGVAIAKLLMNEKPGNEPTKAQMTLVFTVGKGLSFPSTLDATADAYYAGKGVKRQDPKRAIFWYKPAEMKRYHIIWNDLTTSDADAPPDVKDAVRVIDQLGKPAVEPTK